MRRTITSVAVYCGSNPGADPAYLAAARHLGTRLAERGLRLVFGGSSVGLMGAVADAALAAGGSVLGVTTRDLDAHGISHLGLPDLEILPDMHARKLRLAEAADAFVMIPGGFGTFDEFFEMAAWTQLEIQLKPCGVLDVDDYFAALRTLIDVAIGQRFIRPEHARIVAFADDVDKLLDALEAWVPIHVEKWVDRS